MELIRNSDGNIRTAKLPLPTENSIARPLNILYPLECEMEKNTVVREDEMKDDTQDERCKHRCTLRKAAYLARDRIIGQMVPSN